MTPELREYRRRWGESEAKSKRERWFGWWRNPPDRFAALVAIFTALPFAATLALYFATRDLVIDALAAKKHVLLLQPLSKNKYRFLPLG